LSSWNQTSNLTKFNVASSQDVKIHCASSLPNGLFLQPYPSLWYVFPRLSKPTETSKCSWKRHENPLCKYTVFCLLIHIVHIVDFKHVLEFL
jgi:hypothetical protein